MSGKYSAAGDGNTAKLRGKHRRLSTSALPPTVRKTLVGIGRNARVHYDEHGRKRMAVRGTREDAS